jgi:hypothetical protein
MHRQFKRYVMSTISRAGSIRRFALDGVAAKVLVDGYRSRLSVCMWMATR